MEYTKSLSAIHFLNDRNIAQNLSDQIDFNAIPSLTLLSSVDKEIRDEITQKIQGIRVSDQNIDDNSISQGKIKNISSDYFGLGRENTVLCSNTYSAKQTFSKFYQNQRDGDEDYTYLGADETGISAYASGANRNVSIRTLNGYGNIYVNGNSVMSSMQQLSADSVLESKNYFDSQIQSYVSKSGGDVDFLSVKNDISVGGVLRTECFKNDVGTTVFDEKYPNTGSLSINFAKELDAIWVNGKTIRKTIDEEKQSLSSEYLKIQDFKSSNIDNDSGFTRLSTFGVDKSDNLVRLSVEDRVFQFECGGGQASNVWIKHPQDSYLSDGNVSNLSVLNITNADYRQLSLENKLSPSAIYIVSSDYFDSYGKVISCVTMPKDDVSDYLGVAATKPYVDAKISQVLSSNKEVINGLYGAVSTIFDLSSGMKEDFRDYGLSAYQSAIYQIVKYLSSCVG